MKKLNYLFYLFLVVFAVVTTACKKDNNDPLPADDVLVINEGNFSSADGSLSSFNTNTKVARLGAFESVNGFPIAGTIQNVVNFNGKLYFVTNSADKVEVADLTTLASVASIKNTFAATNFTNPFGFAAVGTKAYVSNWGTPNANYEYENSFLTVIDLSTNTVTGKINRSIQPQHLLAVGQNIYIANVGNFSVAGNTISVLNTADNQIIKEITVATAPDKMVLDKNGKIWVLCQSGNLVRINPNDNTVETTISGIVSQGYNEKMVINSTGDKLYWLGSGGKIYELAITATTAPANPIITQAKSYGLGIDKNNIIYVTDHNGYTGNGKVRRFQTNGTLIDEFGAGRIPSGFIFR